MARSVNTTVTTAPTAGAVTLTQAKQHLSLFDDTSFDNYINELIFAGTELVGIHLDTHIDNTQVSSTYFGFDSRLFLDHHNVASVESVSYTDSTGSNATLAPTRYRFDDSGAEPCIIVLDVDGINLSTTVNAPVRVAYTVGMELNTENSPAIQQAVLLYIKDMFEQRGNYITGTIVANLPLTARALLGRERRSYV